MSTRVVVLPPVPALLPAYVGRVDAVEELRNACRKAIGWLLDDCAAPLVALADPHGSEVPLGIRVARSLLDEAGYEGEIHRHAGTSAPGGLLVMANGSGSRSAKAPGHLDPRSFPFDEQIETALAEGDPAGLADLDVALGRDLLASGIEPLRQLGAMRPEVEAADLSYADDPYGVRYWVATWLCESAPRAR